MEDIADALASASALAVALTAADCGIPGLGTQKASPSVQVLAGALSTAFVDAQTCACESATTIVGFSAAGIMQSALDIATAQRDNVTPENAQTIVDDLTSQLASDYATFVADTQLYAQQNCEPGTVDGVLSQSFVECGTLSSGNATELSTMAGTFRLRIEPKLRICTWSVLEQVGACNKVQSHMT